MSEPKDKKTIVKYDNNTGDIDNSASESYVAGYVGTPKYGIDRKFLALITFAVLLLIVGIVLIVLANVNSCESDGVSSGAFSGSNAGASVGNDDICNPSEEADRVNLNAFLVKVRDVYHDVFPEEIAWLPEVTDEVIRNKFKVHDPTPENLKKIWEQADELLKESIKLVSFIFFSKRILCQN